MMKNMNFLVLLFVVLSFSGQVCAKEPDYSLFDKVLKKYVKNASVNYVDLAKDQDFETFMKDIRQFDLSQLESKNEKKAFYINLYNALTLEVIVKNLPVKSIKKIGILGPWDKKVYENGGNELTLNDIEHKILRPMGDFRIHFAINCASIGCPDIRAESFVAEHLNRQLGEQMVLFLNNRRKGVEVDVEGVARVSKIFDWFAEDFGEEQGVLTLLQRKHPHGAKIKKVEYKDYDWNLNGVGVLE